MSAQARGGRRSRRRAARGCGAPAAGEYRDAACPATAWTKRSRPWRVKGRSASGSVRLRGAAMAWRIRNSSMSKDSQIFRIAWLSRQPSPTRGRGGWSDTSFHGRHSQPAATAANAAPTMPALLSIWAAHDLRLQRQQRQKLVRLSCSPRRPRSSGPARSSIPCGVDIRPSAAPILSQLRFWRLRTTAAARFSAILPRNSICPSSVLGIKSAVNKQCRADASAQRQDHHHAGAARARRQSAFRRARRRRRR